MSMKTALSLAREHPHDFTLQYPPRREYFQERFRVAPCSIDVSELGTLLLYVHVPFCASRCAYCNFAVDVRDDRVRERRYVDAVLRELEALERTLPRSTRIGGIDVGGGTPTKLSPFDLDRLLAGLDAFVKRASVPRPLSVETTPEIAANEAEKLATMRARGVDRVSVGLQSTDLVRLSSLGREPSNVYARAIENLRRAGFARVNVDLIFGLPDQDEDSWQRDLERTIALGPDSITTYDCLYRGKGRALTRRTLTLPSPARYGALYDLGFALLRSHGYHATYGSVNHSRLPGETGTSPYFEGRLLDGLPYLGVGNYATSHRDDVWTFAEKSVDRFIERSPHAHGDAYVLPTHETMTKYALLSLSFGRLDRDRFSSRFSTSLEARFGESLRRACDEGWLAEDARGYGVARFDALPSVRALLYTDEAIDWLAGLRRQSGSTVNVVRPTS